jgi:hypothetical protein
MLMPAFETLAITSPIMPFVGTSVMPGLFFQPISLVRIDPVPVARTTAIFRRGLAALVALVFKPRPVILPIVLLFRTSVTSGLILKPPGILRIDNRVQRSND